MRKFLPLLAVIALVTAGGCKRSVSVGKNPDPSGVSGKITVAGKPVNDVVLNLVVVSNGTLPATMAVKNGEFKGSAIPGTYSYYFSEGVNPGALTLIPEQYRKADQARTIEIKQGEPVTLALN